MSDQAYHVCFTHTCRSKHQNVVFNAADHFAYRFRRRLSMADAIEVGANFGRQNRFGLLLFNDVLI